MKKGILITTTNSVEGAKIENYFDLISTNVVVGTNFFSDLGASFTDIFGGLSDTYQNKLQGIYKIALDRLRFQANNIGANAIIGLKIDFDEVSGKGKSMFMISAIGTAVKIKFDKQFTGNERESNTIVVSETLQDNVTKKMIINKVKQEILPSSEDWNYLVNRPISEIADFLLNEYIKNFAETMLPENQVLLRTNIGNYFKHLDIETSSKVLYERIGDMPGIVIKMLVEGRLFSAENIIKLFETNRISLAVRCLKIEKPVYSDQDLTEMQKIIFLFEDMKDLGGLKEVKGTFGKAKMKYICPQGHSNPEETIYCNFMDVNRCGKNRKGLTEKEVEIIEEFKIRTETLSEMLKIL